MAVNGYEGLESGMSANGERYQEFGRGLVDRQSEAMLKAGDGQMLILNQQNTKKVMLRCWS
jgi:hypothetical protein